MNAVTGPVGTAPLLTVLVNAMSAQDQEFARVRRVAGGADAAYCGNRRGRGSSGRATPARSCCSVPGGPTGDGGGGVRPRRRRPGGPSSQRGLS